MIEQLKIFAAKWELRAMNFESMSKEIDSEYLSNDFNAKAVGIRLVINSLRDELLDEPQK
jgi:hypothetical protein